MSVTPSAPTLLALEGPSNQGSDGTPKRIYPDTQADLLLLDPPPPYPRPVLPELPLPLQAAPQEGDRGPAQGKSSRRGPSPDSTALPLRAYGVADDEGNIPLQYWPFPASDLYNLKTLNPSFSKDPQALTGLIDSILFSHQPTWDDCQQLLQVLLTMEERQRVILEARKNVPGDDGHPTAIPNVIDDGFPLARPRYIIHLEVGSI